MKSAGPDAPIRSLEGFQRVALGPKERKTVRFTLRPRQMTVVDSAGHRRLQPGEVEISLGGQQTGGPTAKLQLSGAAQEIP